MTLLEAILLGLVQGLFMFVPVSSTSHLALVQHWLTGSGSSIPAPDDPEMILFDLVVHVGTVVSIIAVMHAPLRRSVARCLHEARAILVGTATPGDAPHVRVVGLMAVSLLVTGLLGLAIRAGGTWVFGRPAVIAGLLVVTGGVLWWTDRARPDGSDLRRLGAGAAIAIGVAQGAALFPGLSRSGLTIAAALAVGMARTQAARYSFFLAIPTILGATVIQAVLVAGEADPLEIGTGVLLTGAAVAAASGAVALSVVLRLLEGARFRIFVPYVWGLALLVLLVGPTPFGVGA